MKKLAIVLFSGGLDSTVMLALAQEAGYDCIALSFDYSQRHKVELQAAQQLCQHYGVEHLVLHIDPAAIGGSALTGDIEVPRMACMEAAHDMRTPPTYVPARNTLFLTHALVQAEIRSASAIYFGPNAADACYPDCTPAYISTFRALMQQATRQAIEGQTPALITPLLTWDKRRIVEEAMPLRRSY